MNAALQIIHASTPEYLTQKFIKSILHYDPETGVFTWSELLNRRSKIKIAGRPNGNGHIQIFIRGKMYMAHRLAFLYMTGSLPEKVVDHINRDRSDNSWKNLRSSDYSQNCCNITDRKDNTSGCRGVFWRKESQKWRVIVVKNKKRMNLGSYEDFELAELIAKEARVKYHGEFAS